MLRYRLTLGPVFIAILIGAIGLDEWLHSRGYIPGIVLLPLVLLLALIAARELNRIFRLTSIETSTPMTATAVVLGLLASSLSPRDLGLFSGVAIVCSAGAVTLLGSLIYYSRNHNVSGVVAAAAATVLAFVYPGLLAGFLIVLRKDYSGWLVLGVLLVTKSYDIGAFFVGRSLGKNKLIEWLSPGKTWEGLFGGVCFSALMGLLFVWLAPPAVGLPTMSPWLGLLMGGLFGLIGQAGDLVASLLKRDAGLKDYSTAIPGFGGVLDVVDSPLLVAPVAYWFFFALRHAGPEFVVHAAFPSPCG